MTGLATVRARWGLLQTLHPLFHSAESLPTVERASQGCYGTTNVDSVDHLKNEITMLRSDLSANIFRQQQVTIDQLTEGDPSLERLECDLQKLLERLEDLIDPSVLSHKEADCTFELGSLACFPKLAALRKCLQNQQSPGPDNIADRFVPRSDPDTSAFAEINTTSPPTESSLSMNHSATPVAYVANLIRFPQDVAGIEICRRTVSQFGEAIDRISGSWAMDPSTQDYTSRDLEAIKHAHDFASTCTSLFSQMAKGTRCGAPHKAKLHLSGFEKDQVAMDIGTCQGAEWVSAMFTHSLEQPSMEPSYFDPICSLASPHPEVYKVLHVAFNSESMWASNNRAGLGSINNPVSTEQSLDHLLAQKNGLETQYRKLTGFLLAASMFQLSDSPWIEQHLGSECILVPPPDDERLSQWCPRILCALAPNEDMRLLSDSIAALGVLVLELEADCKAEWIPTDEEWPSGKKSNQVRLARIINAWKSRVIDDYREVARACLQFDSLIETLNHPDITSERKGLAVIYKHILDPLFRHMAGSFGDLATLFRGMLGPTRSLTAPMNISSTGTAKRVLFDDDDALPRPEHQSSASRFLDGLNPFFQKIKTLQKNCISLVQPPSPKARIAVLDSGVDDTDAGIRGALRSGRINTHKSKSFVGRSDEWRQDTYGHGTHVTRLLLRVAPAAEIYVGKICIGKVINDECMPGIAKAIDWAVDECDADIISISFGFEDENDFIDEALDNAIRVGKLIIAAASNNGGLSGRARPARQEGVICIHATDGYGNWGGMNPSRMANNDNFATLGVAVPMNWKGKPVSKSGTSFAVPIAVGFAADVLEFANYKCTKLKPRKLKKLGQKQGMQAIFRKMSEERQGYDFIHPRHLWKDWLRTGTAQYAMEAINDIMNEL